VAGRAGPKLAGSQPIGLSAALRQGSVTEDTITQAAGRVLRQLQRFGYIHRPVIARRRGCRRASNRLRRSPGTRPFCGARPSTPRCCSRTKAVPCRCRGRIWQLSP